MSKDNKELFRKVYEVVERIPSGKVTTYGAIAKSLGMKNGARVVGWAMNGATDPKIPCHRVINSKGELSGRKFFASEDFMEELLTSEGVEVKNNKVDLSKYFWQP